VEDRNTGGGGKVPDVVETRIGVYYKLITKTEWEREHGEGKRYIAPHNTKACMKKIDVEDTTMGEEIVMPLRAK